MDAFFEQLVETSVDGLWVIDLEGRTLYANHAAARLLDCDRERLASLRVHDFLDDSGREQFDQHLDDVRRGRINLDPVEVRHRRLDGSDVWALLTESPLRDDDGHLVALVHRLTDHRVVREVQENLAHDRAALSEAQEIARLCTWHWDIETDQVFGSEGLCRIYGVDPSIFPMTYDDWNSALHPEDRAGADDAVRAALEGADRFDYVVRAARGDGVWLWTRSRGVVHRDEQGRAVELAGTSQDVHEQRSAVLVLEDMLAQNQLMHRLAAASNESQSLLDAMITMRGLLLDDDDWRRARAFLVDGGELTFSPVPDPHRDDAPDLEARHHFEELVSKRANDCGKVVWSEDGLTVGFPVCTQGQTHAVVVLTIVRPTEYRDLMDSYLRQVGLLLARVVERETAARSLAVARDAAQHALRAKTDFLAMMSHEIRTPLNGVLGLHELLSRSSLTADQRELCNGIGMTGRHLLYLINDILDFSKIESGHLTLEVIDFDLRGSIESAAAMVSGQAAEQGIDLCVVVDPCLPHVVSGDPTRLAQVVTNLTSNAVKFTEAGSVVVRAQVGAPHADVDGVSVRLSVTDTGVGIPEDAQQGIFAEFGQADASTARTHGGTGLGLAICQRIVEAYHGELEVESTPGQGSTFFCDLVLGEAAGTPENPLDLEVARAWGGRSIVVLTSTETRFTMVRDKLATWGSTVLHATDVASAVGLAATKAAVGAVVVDLAAHGGVLAQLAEGDLRALVDHVRDDVRVILLGQAPGAVAEGAGVCDAVQSLSFPVSTAALRVALADVVDGNREAVTSSAAGHAARVLVVEDNPVNQIVATGMLDLLGYEHDLAEHGGEALEVFDPEVHALVLMDVQMPVLDGYEATRRLLEMYPDLATPVVAMTANAIDGERERCLASGMVGYLTKPVDVARLSATLDAHLAGWSPPSAREEVTPSRDTDGTCDTGASPQTIPATESWDDLSAHLTGIIDTARIDDLLTMGPKAIGLVTPAIARLIESLPGELDALIEAQQRRRTVDVAAVAHRVAGAALNLGVTGVGEAARTLEHDARQMTSADAPVSELDAMVAHLSREVQRAVPALQQCLQTLAPPYAVASEDASA